MSPRTPLSMVKPRHASAPLPPPCRLFRPAAGPEAPSASDVGILLTGLPDGATVSAGPVTVEGDGIPMPVELGETGFVRARPGERTRVIVEELGGDVRMLDVTLQAGPPRPVDYADVPLTISGDEALAAKNEARVYFVGFDAAKVQGLAVDGVPTRARATAASPLPSVALEIGPHALEADVDGIRRRLTVDLQPGELLDLARAAFARAPAVEAPPPPDPLPYPSPSPSASPAPSASPGLRVTGDARVFPSPPSARVTIGGVEVVGPSFFRELAPGRYPVQVSAAGYESRTATIDVRSGEASELRVELAPAAAPARSRAPAVVLGIFAAVAVLTAAAAAVGASRADRSDPSTEW